MIALTFSLNFDPVKGLLKMRCHIYILMKKVIILRKIQFYGYVTKHIYRFQYMKGYTLKVLSKNILHLTLSVLHQTFSETPSLKMFLLKLYWRKLRSPKRSKVVKIDNKVIIVLIFINFYFALIYHPHHQRPPQMICYHKF